jgi:hypothetical protein
MASYSIRIKGLKSEDGTVSVKVLTELLQDIQQAAQRSVRLLLDGSSVKHGPAPAWLEASTDFLITGLGKGSTVVELNAPVLGETAAEFLQQPDMWREIPSADDTSLTILALCLHDAVSNNLDSDRFDRGVLESIAHLDRVFKAASSVEIVRRDCKERASLSVSSETLKSVQAVRSRTPDPQSVVISGKLEEIGHKAGQFKLELPGLNSLRGRVHPEFLDSEDLRNLWGKKVSIRGVVHFKPSGAARFIEAEVLKLMETGEEIFERLPVAVQMEAPFAGLVQAAKETVEISEFWGQWPGDESIEELLAAL